MYNMSTIASPSSSPSPTPLPPSSRYPGDPLISDMERQTVVNVLLYCRYIAAIIAIPLTVLNIVIFLQPHMGNATSRYVIGLSVAQLYYVIVTSVLSVMETTLTDPFNNLGFVLYNLYASVYGGIVARRGSYLAMCLVSVERLYAIVRPLHVKTFLLSHRPLLCVLSAYLIAAIMHVYIPAKTVVREKRVEGTGQVVLRFAPTDLYLKHKEVNDAFSVVAKVLLTYLALLGQIVLNVLTVYSLRRHNLFAADTLHSSSSDHVKRAQERQLTVTILAATAGYVTLSLPAALHNLIYTLMPNKYGVYGTYYNAYIVVYHFSFLLSVLSSAVDFFCFYALSSNYRKTFHRLFRMETIKTMLLKLNPVHSPVMIFRVKRIRQWLVIDSRWIGKYS